MGKDKGKGRAGYAAVATTDDAESVQRGLQVVPYFQQQLAEVRDMQQIKLFFEQLSAETQGAPQGVIASLQKIKSIFTSYLGSHEGEVISAQVMSQEIIERLQAHYIQHPEIQGSKSIAWYTWMLFNGLSSIVVGTGTSGASVVSLFGQYIFDHGDAKTFIDVMRAGSIAQDVLECGLALGAIGGIMWFNVSGCEGLRQELSNWQANPAAIARKALRFTTLAFAGTAMSTLAQRFNWPFMLGLDSTKYAALYWVLGSVTWVAVGAGIGGVLTNHAFDNAHYFLPGFLYGKERKEFAKVCDKFRDLARLKLHGQGIDQFHRIFTNALDLPTDATHGQIQSKLNMILADHGRAQAFFQRMQGIFAMQYPTARAHWGTKLAVTTTSLFAAFVGVYSLFFLVKDNQFPNCKTAGGIMGVGLVITNAWLWANSLYEFIMNSLNPRAYFADTYRNSSKKDIALRTFGSALAACFGMMMGLIPLLENKNDTARQKVLTGLEFIFGVGINTLIGIIGVGAVWQYFMGWINPVPRDIVYGDIDAMKQAFFALEPGKQRQILEHMVNVMLPEVVTQDVTVNPTSPSATEPSAIATTSSSDAVAVAMPTQSYTLNTLGGQLLNILSPAKLAERLGLWRTIGSVRTGQQESTPLLNREEAATTASS